MIAGFICLLLVPRLLVQGFYDFVWDADKAVLRSPWIVLTAAVLLLVVCAGFIEWNLERQERRRTPTYPPNARQIMIQITIVLPALITAVLIANLLGNTESLKDYSWPWWAFGGGAAYLGLWIMGCVAGHIPGWLPAGTSADEGATGGSEDAYGPTAARGTGRNVPVSVEIILWAFLVGICGGLLFQGLETLFARWKEGLYHAQYLAAIITWGSPLVILLFSFIVTLHIGLMGRRFSEKLQEWWSRLGGWLLIVVLAWTLWFGIAVYGPTAGTWIVQTDWSKYGLTSSWLLANRRGGSWRARAPPRGRRGPNARLEFIARMAPYVFATGLLLSLSHLTNDALESVMRTNESVQSALQFANARLDPVGRYLYFMVWTKGLNPTLLLLLPCAALAVLFAWRVDINRFSMHLLYRNRLTRCYLGASNKHRKPQPFTGFDDGDDLALSELTPTRWAPGEAPYCGPYLIGNTALNLVSGKELAWQERKAASFVLTPGFCGYELPAKGGRCFRTTGAYAAEDGGISLGTAMAISGAAVSPNMGYHSSPPLAFLLTVFNIRLGWWLGNPRGEENGPRRRWFPRLLPPPWKLAGPRFGLFCLASELFGLTSDRSNYVYLSDGGHFDNLGLYELVRRRCRYIISCDAGQDPELKCDDLGNAIRKCAVDFGIEIEIDVASIRARKDGKYSQWHCAVGTVRYDKVDPGAAPGTLIYLKSSLTGDEPTDLLSYDARMAEFPHQSTADQWFDESQFESYRELGRHIAKTTFEAPVAAIVEKQKRREATLPKGVKDLKSPAQAGDSDEDDSSVPDAEALFHALRQTWYPPSSAVQASFSKHGKTLEEIFERLRKDDNLKFLDAQFYPEWEKLTPHSEPAGTPRLWLPESPDAVRAGFYLCNSMIQLMENVYLDLRLEQEYDHPDTRGWMNLFKHWAWSAMFRATWAVCVCTYGARFQVFCKRHLGLTTGEVEAWPLEPQRGGPRLTLLELVDEAVRRQNLNLLEAKLIGDFCEGNDSLPGEPILWIMQIAVPHMRQVPSDTGGKASGSLTFTFGFALVDARNRIAYFRVQDHLRKMGLARKGLKTMVRQAALGGIQLGIELGEMPATASEVPTDEDRKRFRQLYKSVCYELNERDGGRCS